MSNRDPLTREAGRLLRDLTPVMTEYREKLAEVGRLRRQLDEHDDDDETRDRLAAARAVADQLNAKIEKGLDVIERHAHGLGDSHEAQWVEDDDAGF